MSPGAAPDFSRWFTSAPALFLVVQPDAPRFTVVACSDAFLRATLTRREQIVGQPLFDVFPDNPDDPDPADTRDKLRASIEHVLAAKVPDATSAPVLGDRGELQYIIHRVEERTARARARSAFLNKMSHELRTPLNSIIGFSDLLHEDAIELAAAHREHLRYIRESGRHLLRLIGDLVDLSRIEAGRVSLVREPVALQALCAQVRDQLKPQADAAGVSVVVDLRDELPTVDADAARMTQILTNLLSNAIKFTPRTGMVRITAQREDDMVAIAVADTGVGIAPEDVPRLFNEFERIGEGRSRRAEGTGLGLALTHGLVELHRGTIDVESTPGRGSTFTVRIPVAKRPSVGGAPGETIHPPFGASADEAHTVLLVEDDVLSQKLAHAVLSRRGYIVSVAATLHEARAVLRHIAPTIIVTDIEFPDGGGKRLLEELRADARTAKIPVIAMTAHAMDGEREHLLQSGFDAYISKPIAIDELTRQVETLINSRSGRPNK